MITDHAQTPTQKSKQREIHTIIVWQKKKKKSTAGSIFNDNQIHYITRLESTENAHPLAPLRSLPVAADLYVKVNVLIHSRKQV